MTEYKITGMKRDAATGMVTMLHWEIIKTDGEHTASVNGSLPLTGDPGAPDFVPFEQIDEATAIEWFKNHPDVDIEHYEKVVQNRLDNLISPKEIVGLPWEENESVEG